jgi:antitoxin MazE
MKTQLAKWGNSVAVRIPKALADAVEFRPGDTLEMTVEDSDTLQIRKKKGVPKLRQLVRAITPENRHAESDWGAPSGKELW